MFGALWERGKLQIDSSICVIAHRWLFYHALLYSYCQYLFCALENKPHPHYRQLNSFIKTNFAPLRPRCVCLISWKSANVPTGVLRWDGSECALLPKQTQVPCQRQLATNPGSCFHQVALHKHNHLFNSHFGVRQPLQNERFSVYEWAARLASTSDDWLARPPHRAEVEGSNPTLFFSPPANVWT